MLNIRYKKLCLVKCVVEMVGITLNKEYKVLARVGNNIQIKNDYGLYFWYNKKFFERVK